MGTKMIPSNDELKKIIFGTVHDLAIDFVKYDRREDEDLPAELLKNAITSGVVTTDEIAEEFRWKLNDMVGK
jgi:hypothetical protein